MGFWGGESVIPVLFISWPLDKGPYVFHCGTHWSLAVLHAHGGFLCQVWFCTFTLLSLLSPLQPWFCSQAFSRACRTSCVLELSGFSCRCQDASNKKNYQVARSKQIEKQLCFTQCIVRLFSLSIVWKWTSVQKATEHIRERIQSRTMKHKDAASHSRDPWSSVGRRGKFLSSFSWEQRNFDSFSGGWMDQDQLPKYKRVRGGSLDWLFGDHSDHLKAPHRSEDVTWIHALLGWRMRIFAHAKHTLTLWLHTVPVVH